MIERHQIFFMLVLFVCAVVLFIFDKALWGVLLAIAGILLFDLNKFSNPLTLNENTWNNTGSQNNSSDNDKKITSTLEFRMNDGVIEGRIIAGIYKGRSLQSMKKKEIVNFYKLCKVIDQEGAAYLEAYLDNQYPNWKDDSNYKAKDTSKREAYNWLNLKEGCSKEEADDAYKAMRMKAHPDTGGSDPYFQKLTEMYELILRDIG